jgi:hypothetical protein
MDDLMEVTVTSLAPSCPFGVAEGSQNLARNNNRHWYVSDGYASLGGPAGSFSPAQVGPKLHDNRHAEHWEREREPEMLEEEENSEMVNSRASPTPGSGMPIEDLRHPPSPPPSGTSFDCELESAPTTQAFSPLTVFTSNLIPCLIGESLSSDGNKERRRKQIMQLGHWKALLMKQPDDELAFFWREQVAVIESLLQRQEKAGAKRVAENFDDEAHKYARKR